MNTENRYKALINNIRDKYSKSSNSLIWDDLCEEINLWTYWQGRGHLDTCKILLVGQDWGSIGDDCCDIGRDNVRRIKNGEAIGYMTGNADATNKMLVKLFKQLGYPDITEDSPKNQELFFTNLCLGYRTKKTSGNLPTAELYGDLDYFKELVDILRPKVIICLGKQTWKGVIRGLVIKSAPTLTRFNEALNKHENHTIFAYPDGTNATIFAVAHPGAMGTLNRNRVYDVNAKRFHTDSSPDKQENDWKNIKDMAGI